MGMKVTNKNKHTGLDTTSLNDVTDAKAVYGRLFTVYCNTTGTHVLTVEISPDGTNWHTTLHTITGKGLIHVTDCNADVARAKVTTIGTSEDAEVDIIGEE